MRIFIILSFIFPATMLCQENIGSWRDSTTAGGCKYLHVQKVELGINKLGLLLSPDTTSQVNITVKNNCKTCKASGPDYTVLIVRDRAGQIIGQEAINGIPQNGKTRMYEVPCNARLKKLPENLKISLVHYCMDLKIDK